MTDTPASAKLASEPYRSGFVAVVGRPNVGKFHFGECADRHSDRYRIVKAGNHS